MAKPPVPSHGAIAIAGWFHGKSEEKMDENWGYPIWPRTPGDKFHWSILINLYKSNVLSVDFPKSKPLTGDFCSDTMKKKHGSPGSLFPRNPTVKCSGSSDNFCGCDEAYGLGWQPHIFSFRLTLNNSLRNPGWVIIVCQFWGPKWGVFHRGNMLDSFGAWLN